MDYRTLDPTTEELIETFPLVEEAAVDAALDVASAAFRDWRRSDLASRAALLSRIAAELERRVESMARLMALEMGKPLEQGRAEARKCAAGCRWFAEHGVSMLAPDARPSDGSDARVVFAPLGPVLAIMPWNFPFWQFYRFAAPALIAGNAILLKHAPGTPRCALEIVATLRAAAVPDGLIQSMFLSDEQAAHVIGDRRVRGVTLTGSTRAGSEVAATAGRSLKPMVLELGGSDPFIVFDDADLAETADRAVAARCQNSGQSCIASKRFLIQRGVYAEFRERFVEGMREQIVGDPAEPATQIGPLARADLREGLAEQVRRSVAAGALVLCGGSIPDRRGYFYPPTVLEQVAEGSPASCEELFGPVAALSSFDDEAEAVGIANQTRYGLGASVWTADPARARRMAQELEAGNVFINGLVKSDPGLPFGGVKDSGFGRELSREGLLEFVNVKTVWTR